MEAGAPTGPDTKVAVAPLAVTTVRAVGETPLTAPAAVTVMETFTFTPVAGETGAVTRAGLTAIAVVVAGCGTGV